MKIFQFIIVLSFTFGFRFSAFSQMPNTKLYSFSYSIEGDSLLFKNATYLSSFNNLGYNNQPSFINDSELFISTNMYDEEKTEVVILNLENKNLYRVTHTIESEYSPTIMSDNNYFTVVRVERNGNDQSLWQYPRNRENGGFRLLEKLENIGYFHWISEEEVVLFLVDNPIKMAIANITSNSQKVILENIGRCFKVNENGELIIVHKLNEDSWYLKSYNLETGRFRILTETLPNAEDFILLPDGSILMGYGSKLYRYQDTSLTAEWEEIEDFSDLGITSISRMAINEKLLVLVDNIK